MNKNEASKLSINADGSLKEAINEVLTTAMRDGLKGTVKQVKQSRYKAFERFNKVYLGEPEGTTNESKNFINTYTPTGAKVQNVAYNVNGKQTVHDFNERQQPIKTTSVLRGGLQESFNTTSYNEKGDLLNMESFDRNGATSNSYENIYQEDGRLSALINYNSDGGVTQKTVYTYSGFGLFTELKKTYIIDNKEVLVCWYKYRLNSKGNQVEQDSLNPDSTIINTSNYRYLYDEEGNRKSSEESVPLMSKEDSYLAKTECDTHGNWIKKIIYFDGKAVSAFIREISYYDEPEQETFKPTETFFNLPINLKEEKIERVTITDRELWNTSQKKKERILFTDAEALWLAERGGNADSFPYLAYYLMKNKVYPSQRIYNENVAAIALLDELVANMNAVVLSKNTVNHKNEIIKYTLTFKDNPSYIVHASQIQKYDAEKFIVPAFVDVLDDQHIYLCQITVLHPSEDSSDFDECEIGELLKEYIDKCSLKLKPKEPEKPEIHVVDVSARGEFQLSCHAVRDNFEIENLDIQYGFGFKQFHNHLMDRFKNESQGLVLFHGLPGTGKTYYIRHLLKQMSSANKVVIYMPPNMVDHLLEPGFLTFLSKTVARHSENGDFCVLLIEDAEPLLASRSSETRVQSITNLLNMTDGLLNDMLKLQIICTFNVDLKQLDAALLRPGRLIARKEFKALPELDANLLAQRLGIKHHFTEPATLSEIYALLKDKNTLIHDEY